MYKMLTKGRTLKFITFLLFFIVFFVADLFLDNKTRLSGEFYVCNKELSFNINPYRTFFGGVIIVFFLSIFFFFKKNKHLIKNISQIGYFLLITGAILNIFDRLLYGCVIDYINIGVFNFPLFNFSDVMINIGVLIIIHSLYTNTK